MIKQVIFITALTISASFSWAQNSSMVTAMEFVEILDNRDDEAVYYYKNNWKLLRVAAKEKGYIHSFQLIEITYSEELPAHLLLITNFKDKNQYDQVESYFKELLEEHGEMRLLNTLPPDGFRKNVMFKVSKKHL